MYGFPTSLITSLVDISRVLLHYLDDFRIQCVVVETSSSVIVFWKSRGLDIVPVDNPHTDKGLGSHHEGRFRMGGKGFEPFRVFIGPEMNLRVLADSNPWSSPL